MEGSFPFFSLMCSYSCWRKRSREALRQHSASALRSFRKGLGCITSLSHLGQGKERGGHSHILHELGCILDHAAWLQVQVFFQLCSGMLAAKWSSPVHIVTRKKRLQDAPCYSHNLLVLHCNEFQTLLASL